MDELELPLDFPATPDPTAVISDLIRFGTSTWTYEGWQGQVYKRTYSKTAFPRECLGEFCQYLDNGQPLFRTVGNDSTFYRPPTTGQLTRYLSQIPEDFEMCFKVWEEITIPKYANHLRYGIRAGRENPNFLNAQPFIQHVLQPFRDANFQKHTGPFLFEFQRHGMLTGEFVDRLDVFFSQLPKDFSYGVEIRNPGVLGAPYREMLQRHKVSHVYNHWSLMPPLAEQHERLGDFTAPFTVLRLLTPLKMTYEAAKKRAAPYNKIVGELPEMREQTVNLVKEAVRKKIRAYVLVNNRAEGNAPITVQALKDAIIKLAKST